MAVAREEFMPPGDASVWTHHNYVAIPDWPDLNFCLYTCLNDVQQHCSLAAFHEGICYLGDPANNLTTVDVNLDGITLYERRKGN